MQGRDKPPRTSSRRRFAGKGWPHPARHCSGKSDCVAPACVRLPLAYTTGDHVAAGEPVYFDQDELVLGGQGIPRVGKVVEFIDILDPVRWPPKSGEPGLDVGHMAHLVIVIRIEDQSSDKAPSDLAGWAQRLDKLIVLMNEYTSKMVNLLESLNESERQTFIENYDTFQNNKKSEIRGVVSSSYEKNALIHHHFAKINTPIKNSDKEKIFYNYLILNEDIDYVVIKIIKHLQTTGRTVSKVFNKS